MQISQPRILVLAGLRHAMILLLLGHISHKLVTFLEWLYVVFSLSSAACVKFNNGWR